MKILPPTKEMFNACFYASMVVLAILPVVAFNAGSNRIPAETEYAVFGAALIFSILLHFCKGDNIDDQVGRIIDTMVAQLVAARQPVEQQQIIAHTEGKLGGPRIWTFLEMEYRAFFVHDLLVPVSLSLACWSHALHTGDKVALVLAIGFLCRPVFVFGDIRCMDIILKAVKSSHQGGHR